MFVCKTVLLSEQLQSLIPGVLGYSWLPQHGVHCALLNRVCTQDNRLWTQSTLFISELCLDLD